MITRRTPARRALVTLAGLALAGAAGGLLPGVPPARAQIAAALGHPLPSPDLPVGTIMVRIVAGNPGAPVVGTDVTLTVGGQPRVARTDAAGRATFAGLPAGATVQARVTADGVDVSSDEFPVPDSGGARVMLTTKPWSMAGAPGAAGGGPAAGAEGTGGDGGPGGPGGPAGPMTGAMPEPRKLSGEPRPEPSDPAGSITVRLTYDDLADPSPPAGVPVTLVGYAADDSVSVATVATDASGRATWRDLDRTGGTTYFATALVPRGAIVDRLVSSPMLLDAEVGVRVLLSSDKRASTAPAIDDLGKLEKQAPAVPAGMVRVAIEGVPTPDMVVELVDATTGKALTRGPAGTPPADPSAVDGAFAFTAVPDVPAGTVDVRVVAAGGAAPSGGEGGDEQPLGGAEVSIAAAPAEGRAGATGAPGGPGAPVATSRTSAAGEVRLALPPGGAYVATVTVNGKALSSTPFSLAPTGGVLVLRATLPPAPRPQAVLEVPATVAPGQVLYARGTVRGEAYRSLPFQVAADHGTGVSLYVFPRVLFTFSLTSSTDDQFLAVQGRFDVKNYSFIPYRAGPDGMVLPLPAGFKGAVIGNQDQREVAVEQGVGLRIMRPIPPGGRTFQAGFSLPVEDGEVHWRLDLPLGTFQSGMEILAPPGLTIEAPAGVQVEDADAPRGHFKVLPTITILPGKSMAMTVRGLPHVAAWKVWAPRVVGGLVLVVLVAGVLFAVAAPRRGEGGAGASDEDRAREARRARLLEELVEVERAGGPAARRAELLGELERLWDRPSRAG